jgi:hypothetical protein
VSSAAARKYRDKPAVMSIAEQVMGSTMPRQSAITASSEVGSDAVAEARSASTARPLAE